MAAGKITDFYGTLHWRTIELADAARACTQAPPMGTKMLVRLLKDMWPAAWCGLKTPSCR